MRPLHTHTHTQTHTNTKTNTQTHMLVQVINCAQLLSKWVGETQKNVEEAFRAAREQAA